jgi:ABC-type lipoprotein export system ATPase subunit
MPMIKRVEIQNYRSCLETRIDLHPQVSVLIGPNGSGKTNILQAIMFLNKMAQQEPYRPSMDDTATISSRIKAVFHDKHAEVQLRASVDAYTDESNNDVMTNSRQHWRLKVKGRKTASFEVPLPFAAHAVAGSSLAYYRYWRMSRHTPTLRRFSAASFPEVPAWAVSSLRSIYRYCKGMRYYSASQFTNPSACPSSFQIEQEGEHRRLLRLRGHSRLLHEMYAAKNASPNDPYFRFMEIVGPSGLHLIDDLTFREVPTSSVDYSVKVGGRVEVRKRKKLLIVPRFRIGRQKLSPNQLSEGTFKTLALLFHVITDDSTALLIEEPEVCVHHGLLASILELIKSYSNQKQMIISTHSDYVLDHVAPENVFKVSFDKSAGTVVRHIRRTMTPKEYAALRQYLKNEGNLGEFWREGGLGDRA